METDNFKAQDLYGMFSVFIDSEDGDIYREDLELFIENIEENLVSRRVTRGTIIKSATSIQDNFNFERVLYSVRLIKDIVGASNTKIEELKEVNVAQVAKEQLLEILHKLNADIFANVDTYYKACSLFDEAEKAVGAIKIAENNKVNLEHRVEALEEELKQAREHCFENAIELENEKRE